MNRRFAPACTISLVVIIAVMSATPALKTIFHTHGVLHPWFHLAVFALVSYSAMFCSDRGSTRFALVLGLMFLGLSTEFGEHVVNGAPIERADVWYDLLGVTLGGIAGWLAAERWKAPTGVSTQ